MKKSTSLPGTGAQATPTYLSESLDTKAVYGDDKNDQDGDPGGRVDLGVPEST
jgi:hypothetical protein